MVKFDLLPITVLVAQAVTVIDRQASWSKMKISSSMSRRLFIIQASRIKKK